MRSTIGLSKYEQNGTLISGRWMLAKLLIVLFLFSCNPEEIGPQYADQLEDVPFDTAVEQGVYIINEGNFNFGNSSLSFYNPSDKTTSNFVYQSVNDGAQLGDIFQSMNALDSLYYLLINNWGKIIVTDSEISFMDEITGFTSPRYFLKVSADKAYVSDLYADEILIVNLNSNDITGSINTGSWIEKMVWVDDQIWAVDKTNNKIVVIDPLSDSVNDEIQLSEGAGGLLEDASGNIWILCDGGWSGDEFAVLYSIDKNTKEILSEYTFSEDKSPSLLRMDGTGEYIYFHEEGVRMMSISATALPLDILIETEDIGVYGLDINPINGDIYICDALDFVQAGIVYRYSDEGELEHSFSVGQIPRECVFVSD